MFHKKAAKPQPHPDVKPLWYPHLDYAGEPMARGQFRDEQPSQMVEVMRHNAAVVAIERFCAERNVPVPPLNEEIAYPDGRFRRVFVGRLEGRRFGIGYEISEVERARQSEKR